MYAYEKLCSRPYDKNLTQWLSAATKGKFGEQLIDTAEYFCSELVADAYRRCGLISRKVNPADYVPDDFAAPTMKLRKGASFGPLVEVDISQDLGSNDDDEDDDDDDLEAQRAAPGRGRGKGNGKKTRQVRTIGEAPATNFSAWSIHELQDYLLTHVRDDQVELRDAVYHVHLKRDLVRLALQVEEHAASRQSDKRLQRRRPPREQSM